jgi:hypothetical protein
MLVILNVPLIGYVMKGIPVSPGTALSVMPADRLLIDRRFDVPRKQHHS